MKSAIVSVVVLLLPAAGLAQPSAMAVSAAVGSRIRLTLQPGSPEVQGMLVALGTDTVTIGAATGPVTVPRSSITSTKVAVGRRGHARLGLLIGAVLGVVAGFSDPIDPNDCGLWSQSGGPCSRGGAVAIGLTTLGLTGLGVGALVRTDRWAEAAIAGTPTAVETRVTPAARGITVTFRF